MKKLESSLLNMVLVLVGICVVCSVLLAWVNHITAKPIAEKAQLTLQSGIQAVMGSSQVTVTATDTIVKNIDGKTASYIVHAIDGGGAAVESSTNGFGGDLRVLVGFNPEGKILGYTILQTSETPGLGSKADKWFQKDGKGNIIGHSPADKPLAVSKDGGEVDAITASTITSRAFLKAVNEAYQAYAEALKTPKEKGGKS